MDVDGVAGYGTAGLSSFTFKDMIIGDFTYGFILRNARTGRIDNVRVTSQYGINYQDKSAEIYITNSWFIASTSRATTGGYGLKSVDAGGGFPEGLNVTNCLFFRYETNIHIEDLYVGKFTDCYMDSRTNPNIVEYNTKTESIQFLGCWFYNLGIIFGDTTTAYTSPKLYRSSIVNCHFNYMDAGIDVEIKTFAHNILCAANHHDSQNIGTHIGYVSQSNNNNITIDGCSYEFYDSYAQMKGAGEHNRIVNIENSSDLSVPIYLEYPVDVSNVGGYNISYETNTGSSPQSYVANATILEIDNVRLSTGHAVISYNMSSLSAPSTGYFEIKVYDAGTTTDNTDITIANTVRLRPFSASDSRVDATFTIDVEKPTDAKILLRTEASSPTITVGEYWDGLRISQ